MSKATHKKLHGHLGKLKGHANEAARARDELITHAKAKLDDVQSSIKGWEAQLKPEDADVLQFRRYKTLLAERQRLQRIVSDHDERTRAQKRPPSII